MQAIKLVNTKNLTEEQWREARRKGIGGSDAACILGLNPWKSPVELWLEKTDQIPDKDLSDNEKIYWGNVLEDVVANEFCLRTGKKLRRVNAILQHPEYPFMLANIDRDVCGERAGYEGKTAGIYAKDLWKEDEVSNVAFIQCQHYMAVTGFKQWYLAVLIAGQKFRHYTVERDEEIIKTLIEAEAKFWDHVVNGTMPEPDGSTGCAEALKTMYPEGLPVEIDLPEDAKAFITAYEANKQELKTLEAQINKAENALKAMLGDAEAGRTGDYLVLWKNTKARESFDSKAFSADNPELYSKYLKIGNSSRRFSIKIKEANNG